MTGISIKGVTELFFGKKKNKTQKKVTSKEELIDILEKKENDSSKLDNVPDEIVAKAIKDLLSKD